MATVPSELNSLRVRLLAAAAVPIRDEPDGRLVLVPASLREASRAHTARELLAPDEAAHVSLSLEAFSRVEVPDPSSCTVRAGAAAPLSEVETLLEGWGLTLGHLSPRARAFTLGAWLEGPYAGLRVIPGGRLESAALSLAVLLRGGGLFETHPAPRSAVGPVLDRLVLGCGGQVGRVAEVVLRALPRPEATEMVHASLERPEDVVALLRAALSARIPLVEAFVHRRARGFQLDLVVHSQAFRARRDRAALEGLVRRGGELKTMRRIEEREAAFEGELGWDRLAWAVAHGGPLVLYRIARESVIVAADAPIKGALALDRVPEPLPPALLAALQPVPVQEGA